MIWILFTVELFLTVPVSLILQDKVAVILTQICKMDKLGLNETERLIESLTSPTNCSCKQLPVSNATMHVEKC